jgi:predicted Zn-dependent protease
MPNDRIASLTELAEKSPHYNKSDSPQFIARHAMMRAKLIGFTGHSSTVARAYPVSDQSLPAKYARAISNYRNGNSPQAVRQTDELIGIQPANAYFHELKGQILLESGQAQQAVVSLRKSLSLKPNSNLIRSLLGHALVATGEEGKLAEAIKELLQATTRDEDNADAYKQLAIAYGRKGQTGLAELASAQASFAGGDYRTAKQIATRAKTNLTPSSSPWVRADEIVNYKPPQLGG